MSDVSVPLECVFFAALLMGLLVLAVAALWRAHVQLERRWLAALYVRDDFETTLLSCAAVSGMREFRQLAMHRRELTRLHESAQLSLSERSACAQHSRAQLEQLFAERRSCVQSCTSSADLTP